MNFIIYHLKGQMPSGFNDESKIDYDERAHYEPIPCENLWYNPESKLHFMCEAYPYKCPDSHPWAYNEGEDCCAVNREGPV